MSNQSSLFGEDELPPARAVSAPQKPTTPQATPAANQQGEPLAARMRPRTLDEIIGQDHLLAPGRILRRSIEGDRIPSMILWGPPGSGKTTMAEVIARSTHARFVTLSAVSAGVADLRKVVEEARKLAQFTKQRTIMFIDEIHRFNKSQQDAILPSVEHGTVTLIGATTENPSFEVNSALLSRTRVFPLKALNDEQITQILQRTLHDSERGLGKLHLELDEDVLPQIALLANGDARTALNILDIAAQVDSTERITIAVIEDIVQHRTLMYDKSGDQHYDTISALHKALRGSDPDAGLYWLARMLEAGEDPLYIVRRLVRFASEDVGMADPQALLICMAAQQAVHFVGLPEASLALAQAVVHLATAPKSNALYTAYSRVQEDVQQTRNEPVPLWLRNAPTRLMKEMDYGKDYKYAHDYYEELSSEDPARPPATQLQEYLPDNLKGRRYYHPGKQGQEASIQNWLTKRRSTPPKSNE